MRMSPGAGFAPPMAAVGVHIRFNAEGTSESLSTTVTGIACYNIKICIKDL